MHDAPRLAIFALETEILARVYERPGELRQSDFDGAQQPIVKGMVRRGALARDRYGFLSVARNGEQYPQGSAAMSVGLALIAVATITSGADM